MWVELMSFGENMWSGQGSRRQVGYIPYCTLHEVINTVREMGAFSVVLILIVISPR